MDEIVRQAMAKWPNVPHCYGWLALDRRGQWRMRDDAAQAAGAAGDPIRHEALLAFIARNYACDDAGRWYFQNGPQRVYVSLAYAPFVVRLTWDAAAHEGRGAPVLTDQLGRPFVPSACLLDEDGNVAFAGAVRAEGADMPNAPLALLHDHDIDLLTQVSDLPQAFELAETADDTADARAAVRLHWRNGDSLPFATVRAGTLPQTYGFERDPQASATPGD
ncbi:DUF2946 family protein [Pandoraea pnomenusa]|uniref:DUF2946 family protein n=1 Tax=Pandoraea pnomenusa TaxID=93220 RepID=UPI0003C7602D|nr:DUF2946 family protein [Pandoraea pnomenusa]AHB04989.1 hypothetical protein U875_05915 [Pandoraea pnomenusa 3kgm]MBN9095705.1 DUF2946 family protein [Pandoraea pnomenusa]QDX22870.1 DUF2946 family protein [Pandoraea pnomenusa]